MQPNREATIYYPYLDGLRFFAFLAVFIHHSPVLSNFPFMVTFHSYGWMGVDLFLCLSAFLFTKLLFMEFQTKGDINVKNFYIRRLLRIWPLYYFFLGGILIYTIFTVGWNASISLRALGMFIFTDNILSAFLLRYNPFFVSGHLWTISYEEQFYAVIPWALRWMFKLSGRTKLLIVLVALFLGSLARAWMIYLHIPHPAIWVLPISHFESIMGGLIAGLGLFDNLLKKIPSWLLAVAGCVALFAVMLLPNVEVISWGLMLTYPLVGMGMYLILCSLTGEKQWPVKSLLQNKILAYLGKISYGLYVYHILAINFGQRLSVVFHVPSKNLTAYPGFVMGTGLVMTILISMASYQFLEKPFLRFKKRFTTVPSRPV